jgi:hypothetical protein
MDSALNFSTESNLFIFLANLFDAGPSIASALRSEGITGVDMVCRRLTAGEPDVYTEFLKSGNIGFWSDGKFYYGYRSPSLIRILSEAGVTIKQLEDRRRSQEIDRKIEQHPLLRAFIRDNVASPSQESLREIEAVLQREIERIGIERALHETGLPPGTDIEMLSRRQVVAGLYQVASRLGLSARPERTGGFLASFGDIDRLGPVRLFFKLESLPGFSPPFLLHTFVGVDSDIEVTIDHEARLIPRDHLMWPENAWLPGSNVYIPTYSKRQFLLSLFAHVKAIPLIIERLCDPR